MYSDLLMSNVVGTNPLLNSQADAPSRQSRANHLTFGNLTLADIASGHITRKLCRKI
jgi:hypothetical protein